MQICDSIVENARILWYRNISEQSVIFFSYEAVMYMLPPNKHTKTRFVLANKSCLWYLE